MKFTKLTVDGTYIIDLEKRGDERGSLTRIWCEKEFAENGIFATLRQGYSSTTKHKGTIRGIHCQVAPAAEDKLTRVVKGKIFEVIVDLRKDSPTFMKWEGVTLSAEDDKMMFIPSGVAHGFLTLTDDVVFENMSSQPFTPEYEKGIRYNDPAFNISWPIPVKHASQKDTSWQDYQPEGKAHIQEVPR
ncbi:MAG: dTDP-4-dehydrorhamnose 3,5-epimerase family protein [bacterium]|nr:dTDP-4-dehydrorhamnose 3,5-epimerase family protein [bacterium]